MKKDIKDYANKAYDIRINNEAEYRAIVPLLNTVFRHWSPDRYETYYEEGKHVYIHLSSDSTSCEAYSSNAVLDASEFIGTTEINNTYNLW